MQNRFYKCLGVFALLIAISPLFAQNNCDNDNTPPTLECQDVGPKTVDQDGNATFNPEEFVVSASDDCTNSQDFEFFFGVDSVLSTVQLNIANGTEQEVLVSVMDAAGNQSTCTAIASLQSNSACENDLTPPTVVCIEERRLEIVQNSVDIAAEEFLQTASDDCTTAGTLVYSFSTDVNDQVRTFTTNDSLSENLEIWVTDAAGNQAFCQSSLELIFLAECQNDETPPTIECRDSINAGVLDSFIVLQAEFFLQNAVDNCTPGGELIFSFDAEGNEIQRTFMPGDATRQELEIWVTDGAGNQSVCQSVVLFQQPEDCVVDTLSPIIQCQEEIRVDVFSNGQVELWANDFVPSRTDNCTLPQQLEVSFAADTIQQNRIFNIVEGNIYQVPVWVTDLAGNQSTCEVTVILFQNPNRVSLLVNSFIDSDADCVKGGDEPLIPFENVRLELFDPNDLAGQPIGVLPNEDMDFRLFAENTYQVTFDTTLFVSTLDPNQRIPMGDNVIKIQQQGDFLLGCPATYLQTGDLTQGNLVNLPVSLQEDCAVLKADIGTPFLRRCFENTYTVSYCNYGTEPAEEAYIEVEFDAFLEVNSSTLPWTSQEGNVYRFDLGTVASAECGSFQVNVTVSCEAELGQTHCVQAHIFPDAFCDPGANWSGARVEVDASCEGDSVRLLIRNGGAGAMQQQSRYIVIEDVIMLQDGEFQLNPEQDIEMRFPANGSTYRLEAAQVPN